MANIESLGGVLPLIQKATSIYNAADRVLGVTKNAAEKRNQARRDLDLQQLRARQGLEEKISESKMVRDQSILDAQVREDERRRVSALKRETARQRAAFGGAGVTSESGSGEAVLLGLFNESEDEKKAQDQINTVRRQIINDHFDSLRSRNLLELTQLSARSGLISD